MKRVIGIILSVVGVVITSASVILKLVSSPSLSVIGSSDGPTAIFLAGKLGGSGFQFPTILVGIFTLIAGLALAVQRKK